MKQRLLLLLLLAIIFTLKPSEYFASADTSAKIGIMYHETSNTYAGIKNWSLSNSKSEKLYELYKSQGFNVTKLSESDLNDLTRLNQYDSVVFPYTVMMNHQQRENLKVYIRDGGGAIFAFGTARNESAHISTASGNDRTPLIYDTKTWIFEWDNLSEVFHSKFVDDVTLQDFTVKNTNSKHPILQNAYKELGKSSIELTSKGKDWTEIIIPWNNAIQPLLAFSNYSYTDKPNNVSKGSGAAYAIEHGKGRVVFIGFKIYDFVSGGTSEKPWGNTTGDEDGQAFLKHALNWTAENHTSEVKRNYEVTLSQSNISAYQRASDFIVYSTVNVKNNGNVPARGTVKLEILNASGKVIGTGDHTRYLPGLSPDTTQYSGHQEKFYATLPKGLANGTYTIRATFTEGREDRKGIAMQFVTAASNKTFTKKSGSNKATIGDISFFPDVMKSNAAYQDIYTLYNLGIIKGSNGKFNPSGTLTRIQATEMILRALGVSASASARMNATDLNSGDYGYAILATGISLGIIELENGKINAHQPMKRDDMARALVNGFKLQGTTSHTFNDISSTNPYLKEINTLYASGITTGYKTDNTYRPEQTVTRQQFSSFIARTLKANTK